jgi:hypothetical protein
MEDPNAIEQ